MGRLRRAPTEDAIHFDRKENFINRNGGAMGVWGSYTLVITDRVKLDGILQLPDGTPCLIIGTIEDDDSKRIYVETFAWID
jgi:hypothetical protein